MIPRASAALVAAGIMLPALAMSAPPAHAVEAADIPGLDARIKTKGGDLLYFDLEGHWIKLAVYDDRKDGYGVRGYAYADGVTARVYTGEGKGTNQTREYAVPEGKVKIKLCYTKKGKDVKCSKTKTSHAW